MSLPLINLSLGRKQTFTGHDTGTDPCLLLWRSWLIREVECGNVECGWESKHSEGCGNRAKEVTSGRVI